MNQFFLSSYTSPFADFMNMVLLDVFLFFTFHNSQCFQVMQGFAKVACILCKISPSLSDAGDNPNTCFGISLIFEINKNICETH